MSFSKKIREQVHNKYNGHCAYCGCKLELKDMQVDHLVPIFRNCEDGKTYGRERGTNDFENLMPSCRNCNNLKSFYNIDEFRNVIKGLQNSLNLYNTNYRNIKRYGLIEEIDKPIVFYFEKLESEK